MINTDFFSIFLRFRLKHTLKKHFLIFMALKENKEFLI